MSGRVAHDINEKLRTDDVNVIQEIMFPALLLPDFILRGLEKEGFKKPSPIQLSAIPLTRCGLDLIVQAKSGTGKTLVFAVTILESVKVKLKRLQVIVLAPTREIALQNADVIRAVGCHLKGLNVATFIGGVPMQNDIQSLNGCHVAVGAPGRVRHLIEQGLMDSSAVRLLVMDEADKLMEQIFLNDVNYIFNKCCSSKQTLACSATYTPELLEFVNHYMRNGRHVIPEGSAVPVLLGLRQFVYITPDHTNNYARMKLKQEALFQLLNAVRFDQALIFTNYVTRAESLCSLLINKGWGAACLTSKQNQKSRMETVGRLKEHKARIVVATDLASRGLDASSINLVFNLDCPLSGATYLHRMGRAGRFGSQGICITIVSEGQDCKKFCNILGEIGGTSMSVNLIRKNNIPDLWSVTVENLPKIYGNICDQEDDNQPEEIIDHSLNPDSNSSAAGSDTGSLNASSERDSHGFSSEFITRKSSTRKISKIGSRDRKFSNSLREQVEGPESSDYEQNILHGIGQKQILTFSRENSGSSISLDSYKSSDDEFGIIEEVVTSETTETDLKKNILVPNKSSSNLYSNSQNYIQTNNGYLYPNYLTSVQNMYASSNLNNCYGIPQDDWCVRIQMQIVNFVNYSQTFKPSQ